MEQRPPRATLNEVLWRELQALRPELCKQPFQPEKSNQPFKPVGCAAEDRLIDRTDLNEAQRQALWQQLHGERIQNLRELYAHVGQMGSGRNPPEAEAPLTALCLSGGGIRSATFNLGVIQALARAGLLGKFDYLSSVSGGGYIASWLQSWMHRQGRDKVLQELGARKDVNPLNPEPGPVDHLREFSNYLTPKLGLFSGDTWTLAAVVIRNLLLNWLVILPLLAMMVAIPQLAYLFTYAGHDTKYGMPLLYAALGVEMFAAFSVHWHRRFGRKYSFTSRRIVGLCVVPIVVAACLLAAALLCLGNPWNATSTEAQALWLKQAWAFSWLWSLDVPLLGWLLMEIFQFIALRFEKSYMAGNAEEKSKMRGSYRHTALWELVGIVVSGIVASLLLYGMSKSWLPYLHQRPTLYTVLAVPCVLALYLLARVLFVALASVSESIMQRKVAAALVNDADREWWARMSGWLLGLTLLWLAGTSICLFGQWLLVEGYDWVQASIAAAGGIAGALGALMGSRDDTTTSAHPPSLMHKLAMGLAAPLFAICVIALMAWTTASLGGWLIDDKAAFKIPSDLQRPDVVSSTASYALFAAAPAVFALAALLMGMVVNVNRFSLHGMYRNRLVRAYLGASNDKRHPDPFTGFDPADNLRMHALRAAKPPRSAASPLPTAAAERARLTEVTSPIRVRAANEDTPPPQRLLPIVNITLNLLRDRKLAWQQRMAESFSVTPYYCGNFFEGYRDSLLYGGIDGITLGTAVTISGAAANPRMGYCSSPALAFLMTLFNARLGAWLGNTNRSGEKTYRLPGPGQALWPLIGELFGVTTASFKYVNLSDGGHFDNLGLYEVVLRRCRYILVSDAGCDGAARFEDLGNVIRKIRIDFGIPIVFKKIQIVPIGAADQGLYCATAEIQYPAIDGNVECGQLVYIKPTIAGKGEFPIPYDIYSYSKAVDTFPHESTTDQWFSESQFESYRKLGEHAIEQVVADSKPASIRGLVESADRYMQHATTLAERSGAS